MRRYNRNILRSVKMTLKVRIKPMETTQNKQLVHHTIENIFQKFNKYSKSLSWQFHKYQNVFQVEEEGQWHAERQWPNSCVGRWTQEHWKQNVQTRGWSSQSHSRTQCKTFDFLILVDFRRTFFNFNLTITFCQTDVLDIHISWYFIPSTFKFTCKCPKLESGCTISLLLCNSSLTT